MWLTRSGFVLLVLLASAGVAWSATPPKSARTTTPATPSLSTRVAEQKKEIEAQRAIIQQQERTVAAQKAAIDSQAVQVDAQRARLAELEAQLAQLKQRLDVLESQANLPAWEDSLELRIKQVEQAAKKSPELPPDVVSAGDFPGSIRIPGADAAIKFGGRVRTAAVFTLDPLGTDDRFLTNSIPVGEPISGEDRRTNISARASRLNIEFRTPAGAQELRSFFEGDFAGDGNAFRLRHAYAQYRGFIAGQTWSTFSDPWVELEDLDFEGVSSENVIRQPQVRFWWSPKPETRLAVAVETPQVSLTGGQGVNLFPDLIARGFWGHTDGGHLQISGVLRQIRGEALRGGVASTWGGGGSVSGVVDVPVAQLTDRLMFQFTGGVGIARYINDLNSAGGMDAVFDTTNATLKALPVVGWFVGYEHQWKEWTTLRTMNLRSTVLWSVVAVHNYDFQPADSYRRTHRFAANAVFSPTPRVDFGTEYIFGIRKNEDGQHANANQIQIVGLFRF